jgi:hypothetical protein
MTNVFATLKEKSIHCSICANTLLDYIERLAIDNCYSHLCALYDSEEPLSTNALQFFAVVTFTEFQTMVKIDDHYQARTSLIFFISARLLQEQGTRKGLMTKII